ncbi:MAG: protein kinase domain-containing protein [Isosphaeraceae bacterium]
MAAADRHLLLGLLALQTGMIDQGQLVAAFQAWTLNKMRNLADILVARGDLSAVQRGLLEGLADQHLQKHGDVEKSLAAVPASRSARASLAALGEPEIEATLARIARSKNGPATDADDDDPERTGTFSVGSATSDGQRFRILRPHARGGLGAVFVALDGELHREVALKQILDKHEDDPVSRQRFVAEAEITGALEHPGVVPVYGLGRDVRGRPYYAMRFIKGDSLKEAIDRFHKDEALRTDPGRRSLELRKLLRRFTDVCNAIDYAHSRGVIHRDIKPANIIVGKYGETLVVDWGLAKAVGRADPSAGEQTIAPSSGGSSETLPGSALGTPAYMSPEQARGDLEHLGPRSDVYSLGATLTCLLTGKPPFEGEDIGAILRAVQEGQFQRPTQLDPSLDKALEAVCLKAMATQPEDRYPTPKALADDLERWMADEPVAAWREPFVMRARRRARRNRTAMTAAAVALVAGVVGLSAVLAVQTRANADLTRSRAAVQARYDLAVEAIKTFYTGVSEDFLLKQEQFKDVRDRLLKSASDFYAKLGALLGHESDLPSRRALWQANHEVAVLTMKVGKASDALLAFRQVLAAREALAAENPGDPEIKLDVGRSLLAIGWVLWISGRTDEAEATYRRAEKLLVELAATSNAPQATRAALARSRTLLGYLLAESSRADEALSLYHLARVDQEAQAAAAGATTESLRELAATAYGIAELLASMGKPAEAEAEYRNMLALEQKLADGNPGLVQSRQVGLGHYDIGNMFRARGKSQEAEVELRKAIEILRKLAAANPNLTDVQSLLAASHFSLGTLLEDTGKSSEAGAELHTALVIRQKVADDNTASAFYQRELARSLDASGLQLAQAGKIDEAIDDFAREDSICRKLVVGGSANPDDQSALANCQTNAADVLRRSGRLESALGMCERARAMSESLVGSHPAAPAYRAGLAKACLRLGQVHYEMKDLGGAAAAWKRALVHFGAIKSLDNWDTFLMACCHAGLAGVAGRPGSEVSAAEGADQAERAMTLLRQVATLGFRNPACFQTESALDPLRNRADFRILMMDLAFPAAPFARGD